MKMVIVLRSDEICGSVTAVADLEGKRIIAVGRWIGAVFDNLLEEIAFHEKKPGGLASLEEASKKNEQI